MTKSLPIILKTIFYFFKGPKPVAGKFAILSIVVSIFTVNQILGGTFTSKGSGNWNGGATTWTISGASTTAPGSGDIVIIQSNHQITMDMNGACNYLIFQGTQNATTYQSINLNSFNLTMQRLQVDADAVGNGKDANITANILGTGKLTTQEVVLTGSTNGGKQRFSTLNIGANVAVNGGVYFNGIGYTTLEVQGSGIFELAGQLDAAGQIGTFTTTPSSVVKFTGTSSQVIPYLPDGYGNLVIANGEKTLAASTRVARQLDLTNGGLNVGTYTLTLGPLATATGASSSNYVKLATGGKLVIEGIGVGDKTSEVAFPIGTATSFNPVYITNAAASGSFSATITDKVFKKGTWGGEITNGIVDKTWEIAKLSGSANVTLKLGWNSGNEKGSFTLANASIAHLENGWWNFPTAGQTSVDVANRTVTRSGITTFSPFAVQDAGINPLPVAMTYFNAAKLDNGATLTWETASEKNNKGYDVQVSVDGKNFETVAFVASKNGNANYAQRYEFRDKTNRSGLVYYRLKQTDFDGTVSYYEAKVVDLGKAIASVMAFPNPFQNEFEVRLNGAASLEVADLTGKIVYRTQSVATGITTLKIDLSKQPAGFYLLKTTAEGITTTARLIKQ